MITVLLGVEYNSILHNERDKQGGRTTAPLVNLSQQMVLRWMEAVDLIDIWRYKNPTKMVIYLV